MPHTIKKLTELYEKSRDENYLLRLEVKRLKTIEKRLKRHLQLNNINVKY